MNKLIIQAKKFATEKHGEIDHRRKYTNEPYIIHPITVAKMVADVGGTTAMIASALLHDVVEDCPSVTIEEIYQKFGYVVGVYVNFLTDEHPPNTNRATRKAHNDNRLIHAPAGVKTIKLADSIDNLRSIAKHDTKFAKTYFEEKSILLPYLNGGDESLYKIMKNIIRDSDF